MRPAPEPRRRRVVITGIGPVSPVGTGVAAFWEALADGRSGGVALTNALGLDDQTLARLRSRVVARVDDADLPDSGDGGLDRRTSFARLAARLAFDDAGLDGLGDARSAVVFGNAVGSPLAVEDLFRRVFRGQRGGTELAGAAFMRDLSFHTVADELAATYLCSGPVLTISTGCTASLDAIGTAYELVRAGEVDRALTGSAEAPLSPVVFASFDVIGATSRRNDRPESASRPFDRDRDGFVLGEGAAALILEEREAALRRGARIYAEIAGFASVSSAYHMTNLALDGAALAQAFRLALLDAGIEAGAIDHVNAHGSSTRQNDLSETNAIRSVMGRHAGSVTVNSLKSMIGHALGASNALEIGAAAISLKEQFAFPTINLDNPGPGCNLDYVPNRGRARPAEYLAKFSNGFSGVHSVLVMRRAAA